MVSVCNVAIISKKFEHKCPINACYKGSYMERNSGFRWPFLSYANLPPLPIWIVLYF